MADPLLAVANLETYYGPIMAIRCQLRGPGALRRRHPRANGAGKSTILKTVSGVMTRRRAR